MAVSENRKFTMAQILTILDNAVGKKLGEVDSSNQFSRTIDCDKITGIAGDVVEQSVLGYNRDNNQESDIEIDGVLHEVKTTGLQVPKSLYLKSLSKTGTEYNALLNAKEGISITNVTLTPSIEYDFLTSHFYEKVLRLLIVFYEYKSQQTVHAAKYAEFPIVDYTFNKFSERNLTRLCKDWEIVRDFLAPIYAESDDKEQIFQKLSGFTHQLRDKLSLIELSPSFKHSKNEKGELDYQKPRYRLKQPFVNTLVQKHFATKASSHYLLRDSFTSMAELDGRCHNLSLRYAGMTLKELKKVLRVKGNVTDKNFGAKCILKMFGTNAKRLNMIEDFIEVGIIAKTVTLTPKGGRTEDTKMFHVNLLDWAEEDEFEESQIYEYFAQHNFLCPIFAEHGDTKRKKKTSKRLQSVENKRVKEEIAKTTFEGFKRFVLSEDYIQTQIKKTWLDTRNLINNSQLRFEYTLDKDGNRIVNKSGSYKGAPNLPKSSEYHVFFRGSAVDSSEKVKIEINGVDMLPQYVWLKGTCIVDYLRKLKYL